MSDKIFRMVRKEKRTMPEATRRIGIGVKGLMAEKGLSQAEVGAVIGRGQPYVSDRLTAKDSFTTWDLERIAEQLGFRDAFDLLDEIRRRHP